MNRKELRHDRHTVSLLTDHMVFAPQLFVSFGYFAVPCPSKTSNRANNANLPPIPRAHAPQRIHGGAAPDSLKLFLHGGAAYPSTRMPRMDRNK